MYHFILNRETGLHGSHVLSVAESTRRWRNLDLSTEKHISRPEHVRGAGITTLDYDSSEHRYLLCGNSDCGIVLYDMVGGDCEENNNGGGGGGGGGGGNGEIKPLCGVYRGDSGAHDYAVRSVAWYPHDTGMFTSGSSDRLVKVWDTNCLRVAMEFKMPGIVYHHAHSRLGCAHQLIAVGTRSQFVPLIDLRSGSTAQRLSGHTDSVLGVAWSPSEEYVVATGGLDGRLLLWDVRSSGGYLHSFEQGSTEIRRSSRGEDEDGEDLLGTVKKESGAAGSGSSGGGGGVKRAVTRRGLVNSRTNVRSAYQREIKRAHNGGINGLGFCGDGMRLVSTGTDGRMRLWDAFRGTDLLVHYPGVRNQSRVHVDVVCTPGRECVPDMVFHPVGNDVVGYELQSGSRVCTLRGHYKGVMSLHASGRGDQELYSGGRDNQILVYTPMGSGTGGGGRDDSEGDHWDSDLD